MSYPLCSWNMDLELRRGVQTCKWEKRIWESSGCQWWLPLNVKDIDPCNRRGCLEYWVKDITRGNIRKTTAHEESEKNQNSMRKARLNFCRGHPEYEQVLWKSFHFSFSIIFFLFVFPVHIPVPESTGLPAVTQSFLLLPAPCAFLTHIILCFPAPPVEINLIVQGTVQIWTYFLSLLSFPCDYLYTFPNLFTRFLLPLRIQCLVVLLLILLVLIKCSKYIFRLTTVSFIWPKSSFASPAFPLYSCLPVS